MAQRELIVHIQKLATRLPIIFGGFDDLRCSSERLRFDHSKAVRSRDRCCRHLMLIAYDLCCTLADDYARSHSVAGCHAWHDRSIRDAKSVDAIDFEGTIHHTHVVPPHLSGGRLMPEAKRGVADVVL